MKRCGETKHRSTHGVFELQEDGVWCVFRGEAEYAVVFPPIGMCVVGWVVVQNKAELKYKSPSREQCKQMCERE